MAGSEHDDDDTRRARRPKPPERSPEGRIIERSSSHPPDHVESRPSWSPRASVDASGVREHPALRAARSANQAAAAGEREDASDRFKRSTPAERPRKRKSLRSMQMSDTRALRHTPRALPRARGPRNVDGVQTPPTFQGSTRASVARPGARVAAPPSSGGVDATATEREEVTRRSRRPAPPPGHHLRELGAVSSKATPIAIGVTLALAVLVWWLIG